MTDEDMDARLHAAGAAWRTATDEPRPPIADLSPEETLSLGRGVRPRRAHRTAWLVTAAAVAAVLVAGGGFLVGRLGGTGHGHRVTGAESTALENTVWQLLGYGGEQLRRSSLSTFYVHDGAFVADDTCGLYNGTAKVDGDRLRTADVQQRYYNCTDAVGEVTFERGLKTLQHDPTWHIDGNRLTISGDGPTLHLAPSDLPAPTPDRPTVTGATWRLTEVKDAAGNVHPVSGAAQLRIDGNHIHASDTCNTLDATLQVDSAILKLDAVSTTEIGCPQDSLAPTVDRILTGDVRVAVRDATLTLTKDGAGSLTYQWQPDDEPATDPKRLTATDWQLRSIAGVPASGMTLHVGDGRLELAAGCASANAPVELGPGTLRAPGLANEPKNECPPERADVTQMLSSAPAFWRISGRQLIVNHAGSQGYSLVFDAEKAVPAAAAELPGEWRLVQVEQTDGNSASGSGSSDSGITLTITADYAFQLVSHCKTVDGGWSVQGANLAPRAGSHRIDLGCPSFDRTAINATLGAHEWTIDHGQLVLTAGNVKVTYER